MKYKVRDLYEEILKAKERLNGRIVNTPLYESPYLSTEEQRVSLKLECFQQTRSFKIRGAMNKILSLTDSEKKLGVATISSGNHGAAVSYCCSVLGIGKSVIYVPKNTPRSKVDKITFYGSEVQFIGDNYDQCHALAIREIGEKNMTFIDAYDKDPVVYAGQGTAGVEILESDAQIDTILVPIGGGGLITGVGAAVKSINPHVRVVGVQTEACPAMKAALRDKILYDKYESKESICEALIGGIGELAYMMSHEVIDEVITVKEKTIHESLNHMLKREKIICEPSSAVGIAAILECNQAFGKNIAVVVSGGNIGNEMMKSHI